jgi:hypothetical protein
LERVFAAEGGFETIPFLFGGLIGLDEEFLFVGEIEDDVVSASIGRNELEDKLALPFAPLYVIKVVAFAL